jgi:hypothetical protein
MNKVLRIALVGLVVYMTACFIWSVIITLRQNAHAPWQPMSSSKEALKYGLFVVLLQAQPQRIDWQQGQVGVKDAWIERQSKLIFRLVLIPTSFEWNLYKSTSGYYVCILLDNDSETLLQEARAFFVIKNAGESFSSVGGIHVQYFLEQPTDPLDVVLTDNWKFENSSNIRLVKDKVR